MTSDEELREGFAAYLDELQLSPMLDGMARRFAIGALGPALDRIVTVAERTGDVDAVARALFAEIRDVMPLVVAPALGLDPTIAALGEAFDPTEAMFDDVAVRGAAALRGMEAWANEVDEATARYLPPNWGRRVRFGDILTLTLIYGIPLVDHPPEDVVDAFAAAVQRDTSPYAVLDSHRSAILDDLAGLACADVVDDEAVAAHAAHLAEIVEALRHDLNLPAQRAAASLIDVIVREILDAHGGEHGARRLVERHADDAVIVDSPWIELRERSAVHCAVLTLAPFRIGRDPMRTGLNRHASVHSADLAQHTPINAVWAALILGNLLALERRHRGIEMNELRRRLLREDETSGESTGPVP